MPPAAGLSPTPPRPLKLLVFAGVPPPVHGQSVMVAALLRSLQADPAFAVFHIDPRLSRDSVDVGRGRPGKLISLLAACLRAWRARATAGGPMLFYYVPAPGRRIPVFRDWIVMALCRPFFSGLVLHWHAVGLGQWASDTSGSPVRALTRRLLGRAELAVVLAPEVANDASVFRPKRVEAVPNGIEDPLRGAAPRPREKNAVTEVLFLGLGSDDKGLFRTVDAVILANARDRGAFRLTFAGAFPSVHEQTRFRQVEAVSGGLIRHAGFADEQKKASLLSNADVFCFPTAYAHEGQPLVLLEALAHDLPIITTRWRAIPGMLPTTPQIRYVEAAHPAEIAEALFELRDGGPPGGAHRAHFLERFTLETHLRVMKGALQSAAEHIGRQGR